MNKQLVRLALAAVTLSAAPAVISSNLFAQAISVNGGSIGGTITDPSGAAISGASITITGTDTGSKKQLTTDKSGYYQVGPLNPGNYTVSVTAAGFQTTTVSTVIRTGTATPGTFKLSIGSSSTEISVEAGAVQVNTEQGGVSDVITKEQINSLPINGRNFMDVAQIEPGVVLQSGESFDPTKAGYSAISVSGVSGRSTRILLDGQDVTDETVGTTIFNVSQGSINEFQLNRSTQDVTGEVTSTGQVLVSTNSGTNALHGQLFYNFQDYRALFASGGASNPPFQRNQFGGSINGPIIKDKLFFFGNSERIKQDSSTQVPLSPVLAAIQAQFPSIGTPFRDTYSVVRLDYNGPFGGHYFVRGNYEANSTTSNFGNGYEVYATRNNTPGLAGGADFSTGRFTHSFRGSYEKFHNILGSAQGSYDPLPGVTFQFVQYGLYTGPNVNAPQGTFQSDKQFRYDGSWTVGRHNIRYGYSLNRIQGGGFAAFYGLGPRVRTTTGFLIPGHSGSNPLDDYRVSSILFGNGQGFFTENAGFGLRAGGTADWREGAYIAETFKATPSLTLTAGLRWSVDTGRANQDLATPLCSSINPSLADPQQGLPCTGNQSIFGQFNPAFGTKVNQPYGNFGPQIGFVYAPGNHKTVFRGAAGIYYENDVFNNTTNLRSALLPQGALFDYRSVCGSGNFTQPDGTVVTTATAGGQTLAISDVCRLSVRQAAPFAISMQQSFISATTKNPLLPNGSYVGNNLNAGGAYAAPYRTPYAENFNFGIQRELFKGATLTADYVHNATLKVSQTVDYNNVGAARYFNLTAARNAIAAANDSVGCGSSSSQAATACGISQGLTINDYASAGLDSGNVYNGGNSPVYAGNTVATGAAFPGRNALLGSGNFAVPVGKVGYDALQMVYRQVVAHPVPGVESSNLQISYALARAIGSSPGGNTGSGDSFFAGSGSWDNDNPAGILGRNSLDRKHQINFGGSFTMKYGPRVGLIGHFYSAGASNLTLDSSVLAGGAGNIFQSDLNGDGTVGDLLPGTNPGDYMHGVKSSNLQSKISAFNSTYANTLTPAGKVLVSNGLFTNSQLVAIQGAIRPIANLASNRAIDNPTFRSLDVNFSYPIRFYHLHEGLSLEPSIAFYNVGNFANYNRLASTLNNVDDGNIVGGVNQTASTRTGPNTFDVLNGLRSVRGSGTFSQGSPRTAEFQLRLNF